MASQLRPPTSYPIAPTAWQGISAPPVVSSEDGRWPGPLMRWWREVDPDISHPALDHHCLVMHLGGAKRIERRGEGGTATVDIDAGALSIVPAGTSFEWSIQGPIEFAHIYLAPSRMRLIGTEEFDRDVTSLYLGDRLGVRDPLIQTLFLEMLEEAAGATAASRLYLDTLLHSLQLRLLRNYADAPAAPLRVRHSIVPVRLRRVLDYIEANLANDVSLADLAGVAGASPFHFSRAFGSAMDMPPYAYLLTRRVVAAKKLLATSNEPMGTIARQCGFHSAAQFSRMFKRITGGSPLKFRGR